MDTFTPYVYEIRSVNTSARLDPSIKIDIYSDENQNTTVSAHAATIA
jgi:hypothetical protein